MAEREGGGWGGGTGVLVGGEGWGGNSGRLGEDFSREIRREP